MRGWLWFVVFVLVACQESQTVQDDIDPPVEKKDPLLASVYSTELHLSDMPIVSAASSDAQDSIEMIRKAVDRWIKDQLFLKEAEKNIPEDLDIERLVEEYRSSLIRHYFEEKLIKTKLDTVITEFDLKAHYEENKALYNLENSILRCLYLKVKKPAPSSKKLKKWLEDPDEGDLAALRKYCMNNAEFCLINPDKWYKWEDIEPSFPEQFKASDLKSGQKTSFADFTYEYHIQILEYVSKKNDAPFSYIEERANKLIIRERKNRLINELKAQLFEEQKDGRNVQIYVQ
jgi:hypothetical protein